MSAIITAVCVLGGLGLIFGVGLTYANKIFYVKGNPVRDAIRNALPGANCGGCGYPGCDGCADAIANGEAGVNACPVGGAEVSAAIAEILGIEASDDDVRMVARVQCQGSVELCKTKFEYTGIKDCVAASIVNDGNKACIYGCLGLGTCVDACQFDAIHIDPYKKIAVVTTEKCTGCGACVESCPKNVLAMMPEKAPVKLLCHAAEEGFMVSDNCKIGCIGCGLCEQNCNFDAIVMLNNLPQINPDKCVGCMMCAEVCPTGAIWGDFDNRKIAEIEQDDCIGCGMCKRICQFEAIAGERKTPHAVTEACTGCGQCAIKCPKKCITMVDRKHVRDANAKVGTTPAKVPFISNVEV